MIEPNEPMNADNDGAPPEARATPTPTTPAAQPPETTQQRDDRRESGRLEALSDGIFAIAVTLLIFNVREPTLDKAWLSMIVYAISFLTIWVMWVHHHSIFLFIARIDRAFVYLNCGLLMLVVFVNYPTSLVADLGTTSSATNAAAIYSATLVVISIFYNALWLWASHKRHLLVSDISAHTIKRLAIEYRYGPLLYLIAFGIAFWQPWLSMAMNGALAVYWAFTGRITRPTTNR